MAARSTVTRPRGGGEQVGAPGGRLGDADARRATPRGHRRRGRVLVDVTGARGARRPPSRGRRRAAPRRRRRRGRRPFLQHVRRRRAASARARRPSPRRRGRARNSRRLRPQGLDDLGEDRHRDLGRRSARRCADRRGRAGASSSASAKPRSREPREPRRVRLRRAEAADVERVASAAPRPAPGSSSLGSWVRVTTAVRRSRPSSASASSGHGSTRVTPGSAPRSRRRCADRRSTTSKPASAAIRASGCAMCTAPTSDEAQRRVAAAGGSTLPRRRCRRTSASSRASAPPRRVGQRLAGGAGSGHDEPARSPVGSRGGEDDRRACFAGRARSSSRTAGFTRRLDEDVAPRPPQASPTSHAISLVTPKCRSRGRAVARSPPCASVTTAPSMQPPDTEPTKLAVVGDDELRCPAGAATSPRSRRRSPARPSWPSARHAAACSRTSSRSPDMPASAESPSAWSGNVAQVRRREQLVTASAPTSRRSSRRCTAVRSSTSTTPRRRSSPARSSTRSSAMLARECGQRPPRRARALERRGDRARTRARARRCRASSAPPPREIVFTRGTTEAVNLVAQALRPRRASGAATRSSSRAWSTTPTWFPGRCSARERDADLRVIPVDRRGRARPRGASAAARPARVKLVALAHVSNVLGVENAGRARRRRRATPPARLVVVDGAQAVGHLPVDVRALGCDFYGFSGHKMLGPTGAGVLCGTRRAPRRDAALAGRRRHDPLGAASTARSTREPPWRFEAGTPDIAGVVGLGAAIDYLEAVGRRRASPRASASWRALAPCGSPRCRASRFLGAAPSASGADRRLLLARRPPARRRHHRRPRGHRDPQRPPLRRAAASPLRRWRRPRAPRSPSTTPRPRSTRSPRALTTAAEAFA